MAAGDGTVLTLAAAREHLRVGPADDAQVIPLIPAAEGALANHLGREQLVGGDGWPDAAAVPPNVVHAVKLVLTDLFDNRDTPLSDLTGVRHLVERFIRIGLA